MRVVIDGRGIMSQLDGIGRYSLNLISELIETREDISFEVLVHDGFSRDVLCRLPCRASIHAVPYRHISPKTVLSMGGLVDDLGGDLFHSLFLFQPLIMRTPGIITIHDTMWFQHPRLQAKGKPVTLAAGWLYYWVLTRLCVMKASKIAVVSEATREDLVEWCPSSGSKVAVVGVGLDRRFRSAAESPPDHQEARKLGLPDEPFFIHVSNGKPYKNTSRVIEAFARVAGYIGHHLVIIGRSSAFSHQIHRIIERMDLTDRVRFMGSVSDKQVVLLLKSATALVFPSLYEGFGLPVLEAMACGCPVMTSRRGSLAEISGDAPLFVDPESLESLSSGIVELARNEELRDMLRQRGYRQASKYTWKAVVDTVVQLYKTVLEIAGP